MNDIDKAKQLKNHKQLATGLFLLMLVMYILMTWLSRSNTAAWIGYIKSFAEAAMVGALADWFAVTALFYHPLGLPIPHTNLIENSKKSIGDNLGNFVVSNFLTATNIRPYIQRLTVSTYAAQWLEKQRNKQLLVTEVARLLNDIVQKLDSNTIAQFLARKGNELIGEIQLNVLVSNALTYFLNKNEHEALITLLAQKVKGYISENESLVKEKVKAESYFFIPKFVDNKLATKITNGLQGYFEEIEMDKNHRIRTEIADQLYVFAEKLKTDPKWESQFDELKKGLLSEEKMKEYATAIWLSLKKTLQQELTNESSIMLTYFYKTIDEFAVKLNTDEGFRKKIDGWIHYNAYKYILKNTNRVAGLISDTVGNWEGRQLSQKLELEVGKDLQFIRINGTIVGGLVGLLIHTLTELLS